MKSKCEFCQNKPDNCPVDCCIVSQQLGIEGHFLAFDKVDFPFIPIYWENGEIQNFKEVREEIREVLSDFFNAKVKFLLFHINERGVGTIEDVVISKTDAPCLLPTKTVEEWIQTVGGQVWGSGGYSAGYEVLEGDIKEEKIANSDERNQFIHKHKVLITPKTGRAILRVWHHDALGDPIRQLGFEGKVILKKA
jgi:hypothetical protein